MNTPAERSAEPYYIVAQSSPSLESVRVLRQGDAFLLLDHFGDIPGAADEPYGLYHAGMRHLSRSQLTFSGRRLLFLSSRVSFDNSLCRVDLTNPDLRRDERVVVPRGALHVERAAFLWEGCVHETLRFTNFGDDEIRCGLHFEFAADFADIFEIRGVERRCCGVLATPVVDEDTIVFEYVGPKGKVRRTRIAFEPAPTRIAPAHAAYHVDLAPHEDFAVELRVECSVGPVADQWVSSREAMQACRQAHRLSRARDCEIYSDNEQLNHWINQSFSDVRMMLTETSEGAYPYAGVPWYSTEFGRDGIITALDTLWFNPAITRGVLRFLAATQADEIDPARAAEPGKIVHEIRRGEMAELGEVPFGRYYGSVDATPLYVLLAAEYYERTGDTDLLRELWPAITRALDWIDQYGDIDGDGFVEYTPHEDGLRNQGWKDSADAIFHADGRLAEGPIALCEVQGYVYAAKSGAARIANALGERELGERLARQARALKLAFEERFWIEAVGGYALALDGDKSPCGVETSNSLQCLFTEIVSESAAARMARRAFESDFFSGWGIRTVCSKEARYNPMSYHNGSVWPHDNALIALGLARYGYKEAAARILGALLDISLFLPLARLPELICGFTRRADEGPTLYPVACSPQAWAAGAVFMTLQATLGLRVRAASQEVIFDHPHLPSFLNEIRLTQLSVGDARLDVRLTTGGRGKSAAVHVERRAGDVRVVTIA